MLPHRKSKSAGRVWRRVEGHERGRGACRENARCQDVLFERAPAETGRGLDDEIMSKIVAELEAAGCHGRKLGGRGKGVPQCAT